MKFKTTTKYRKIPGIPAVYRRKVRGKVRFGIKYRGEKIKTIR